MVELPRAAEFILGLVGSGQSPWEGWDRGYEYASAGQRRNAYESRRDAIRGCRDAGLLTEDGQLTDNARDLLRAKARAVEAFVG